MGSLALARHPGEFFQMLAFGTYLLIFIAPVWMIGVAVIGLPSLRLLEIAQLDRRVSAIVLGTVVTGGIWFAFTCGAWPTETVSQFVMASKPTLVGALAGAISGYAGWRFGQRGAGERRS